MSTECFCGKVCKNLRGLKIHTTKMGCVQTGQAAQRTGNLPDEMLEEQGLEPNNSAQNLQVRQAPNPHRPISYWKQQLRGKSIDVSKQ